MYINSLKKTVKSKYDTISINNIVFVHHIIKGAENILMFRVKVYIGHVQVHLHG